MDMGLIESNNIYRFYLRRKFTKEALEMAAEYELKEMILCFVESDLKKYYEFGNLPAKIKMLVDEGFILWEYLKYEDTPSQVISDQDKLFLSCSDNSSNLEQKYAIKHMSLTINGEQLLSSYGIIPKLEYITIGVLSAIIASYWIVKYGFL
jgi:hypothetical protein